MFKSSDPVMTSVLALVVVFLVSMGVFWVWKPEFVVITDSKGNKAIKWDKLAAYSAIVGIVVAIVVLLVSDMYKKKSKVGKKSASFMMSN